MADKKTFLKPSKEKLLQWDWWSENPVEIILVAFILVLFFFLPRQGCGITDTASQQGQQPEAPAAAQPR